MFAENLLLFLKFKNTKLIFKVDVDISFKGDISVVFVTSAILLVKAFTSLLT